MAKLNPVLYLISGFRWAFSRLADVPVGMSLLAVVLVIGICMVGDPLDLPDRLAPARVTGAPESEKVHPSRATAGPGPQAGSAPALRPAAWRAPRRGIATGWLETTVTVLPVRKAEQRLGWPGRLKCTLSPSDKAP